MFGDAYTSDFQKCGHCVDLLAREIFQKQVLVDECDSVAGVKTSHSVGIKTLWQVLRGRRDGCSNIGSAFEPKTPP